MPLRYIYLWEFLRNQGIVWRTIQASSAISSQKSDNLIEEIDFCS
ncbi:MAG: hypothetical protein ACOX7X_01795 [Methanosarcina flavescens]